MGSFELQQELEKAFDVPSEHPEDMEMPPSMPCIMSEGSEDILMPPSVPCIMTERNGVTSEKDQPEELTDAHPAAFSWPTEAVESDDIRYLLSLLDQRFTHHEKLLLSIQKQVANPMPAMFQRLTSPMSSNSANGSTGIDIQDEAEGSDYKLDEEHSDDESGDFSSAMRRMNATQSEQQARQAALEASNRHTQASVAAEKEASRMERFREYLVRTRDRSDYNVCLLLIILFNVVMGGVEVDVAAGLPTDQIPNYFLALNALCVSVFFVEIGVGLLGLGLRGFFMGTDHIWNMFDLFIVACAVVEVVIEAAATDIAGISASHLRVLKLLRVTRIFRGIRVMRVIRFVGSLRTLMLSIASTMKALFWVLALLFTLFYGVGVTLAQLTSDHCRFQAIQKTGDENATPVCENEGLRRFWSSVSVSMLTLFKAISGGISWDEVTQPLEEVGSFAIFTFVCFVFFSVFAMLNVITGVFCHSAIESANNDKELATMMQLMNQKQYVETMQRFFNEIDDDGSNCITVEEFENALKDERMSAYLQSVDIDTQDAWALFKMIDSDGSGVIDLEEFVAGCLQLRGPAKAIHMAKMGFENKQLKTGLAGLGEEIFTVKKELRKLTSFLRLS
eukprot:TRINITY_DN48698_c0_g1_i1.p1 TRINITY_DN48698_c0_g1~~TRINITY_DN48698_c0_g1_i1.p1  ORF type:complete len:619 (-),score=125.88 TRINITY_DN48698_c0_g1_i1:76-1932(-)